MTFKSSTFQGPKRRQYPENAWAKGRIQGTEVERQVERGAEGGAFDWRLEAADLLAVLRDGVIIADAAENRIVGWNPAAEQIFGYPLEEATGMSISVLVPERLRARHEAGLARYAATGTGHFLDNHDPLELPALTKSGEEIVVEFQLTPMRESRDGRLYAAAIVRDVTGRVREAESQRKLQESAAASQRLEAVGQLATGVAHDFSNLLMVIMGSIELALVSGELEPDQKESLEAVMRAAERGSSLSRQLLAFSRKSIVSPSAVSLNEALANAAQLLEVMLGSTINLDLQLGDDLPRTMIDAAHVDQILTNFALNAKDAMPAGGTLTIATDVLHLPDQSAEVLENELPNGVYVRVRVTDTGVGMTETTRQRVFEPFFTTKTRERGTGMGLAMVYGIVSQAGGYISCISAPERGTTFEILLPAASVVADPYQEEEVAPVVTKAANILLVDDDPALVDVVTKILERGGHQIISTTSPIEAIRLADEHGPFDLIVTDVVMPMMNGVELARELLASNSISTVLLVSGYPEGALPTDVELGAGEMRLLQKPFTGDQLLQYVAELTSR